MNNEKTDLFWKTVGSRGVMILSTSAGNMVSSRPVSVAVFEGRFYFQTDESYLKYRQLAENPNAALCCKNFSIQGVCRDIGKPSENAAFIRAMKRHYPDAVRRYSELPGERAMEFTPTLAYRWIYKGMQPYRELWSFAENSYVKEKICL